MTTRAMHEVQCDAMKLVGVRLPSAIEVCDWVAVNEYANQLTEIAARGLYHAAQEKQRETSEFAMRGYKPEPEAR